MPANTAAKTSGMHSATTTPERSPKLTKLTISTITTASSKDLTNSPIDSSTISG